MTATQEQAHVYDTGGSLVATQSMRGPSWLDDSRIVGVFSGILIVDIRSSETQSVALPHPAEEMLGNGHGAVAITWARDNAWPDTHYNFVIWQDGEFTDPQDGFPQAWSDDGSKLALLHQFGRNRSPGGWLSVVNSTGGKALFEDQPPYATGDGVDFDQTGRYIAYPTSSGDGPHDPNWRMLIRVVDLQSRVFVDIPTDIYGYFYWNIDGTISTVDADGLTKRTYSPTGDLMDSSTAKHWGGVRSDDGSTVVYYDRDGVSDDVTVVQNAETTTIRAPGGVEDVQLSPDGATLVVQVGGYQNYLRVL